MAEQAVPATREVTSPRSRETAARRLRAWFGRRLIDGLRWTEGPVHVAYHPDAAYELEQLPEFSVLYASWIDGNRRGNGGDLTRLYAFILNIKHCLADAVPGSFAELGVWRGNSAAVLAHFAAQHDRHLFLFDTFTGFDARDLCGVDEHRPVEFAETSLDAVRRTVGNDAHVSYVPGFFPESVTAAAECATYAVVNIDCDLSTRQPRRPWSSSIRACPPAVCCSCTTMRRASGPA